MNTENLDQKIQDILNDIDNEFSFLNDKDRYKKTIFMFNCAILKKYLTLSGNNVSKMALNIEANRGTLSKELNKHNINYKSYVSKEINRK